MAKVSCGIAYIFVHGRDWVLFSVVVCLNMDHPLREVEGGGITLRDILGITERTLENLLPSSFNQMDARGVLQALLAVINADPRKGQ